MSCWLTCISISVVVLIIIVGVIIGVVYYMFSGKLNELYNITRKCKKQSYHSLGEFPGLDNLSDLQEYLIKLCENTTVSKCEGTAGIKELPLPQGYNSKIKLEGSDGHTYGYILKSDNNPTILAFSGTFDFHEWKADLNYNQVRWTKNNSDQNILVHEGFYNIYEDIRSKIVKNINQNDNIIISGHSLGGALATMTALDLSDYNPKVFTFAAPRSGNVQYSDKLKELYPSVGGDGNLNQKFLFRISNSADFIPNLPPSITNNSYYSHAGQNMVFTKNMKDATKNHIEAYIKQFSS